MKKRARLTIDDISHFLAKFAQNSNSVYWLSTPDFKHIEYLSPAYEIIWGRAREELYHNPEKWITYLHPDDCNRPHPIHEMALRIVELGEEAQFSETYRIVRPNGEIRWIMDRGFPIYDNRGRCHGVTGVAMDITQEKEFEEHLRLAKEKAEVANQTKSALIANMSHDLRTPLTGMLGLIEELIDAADSNREPKQLVKKIQRDAHSLFEATNSLLQLYNEILETVCLESGLSMAKEETFDLHQLIEKNLKLMFPAAQQKKLTLSCQIDKQIPPCFLGLRHCLDRCLLNLLSNALKFTKQGFVRLIVEIDNEKPVSTNSIPLKISIKDSGIGIPSHQYDTLFEPFSRLTPSYQGHYQGAGLGLYFVKHYVAQMNASIQVESEVGKGSCFTITLPLIVAGTGINHVNP